jgi:hypothetical protein
MFLAMAEVIDTLEIAHELRQAEVPEPQADVIARQFKRRYEADREELVTWQYLDIALQHQSADLEKKIETVRSELKADIAAFRADMARLERDLILKLGGIVTVSVAIVGALGVLF